MKGKRMKASKSWNFAKEIYNIKQVIKCHSEKRCEKDVMLPGINWPRLKFALQKRPREKKSDVWIKTKKIRERNGLNIKGEGRGKKRRKSQWENEEELVRKKK